MSTPLGSSQWMYSSGEEEVTQQSLKFNDDESQYLSWTPAAAGNRKTWTWSGWVKRGNLGSYQRILQSTSTYSDSLLFNTDDTIIFWGSDASTWNLNTSAKFRDVSAWYHFVISVDTTQATSSDRIKIYVNGNLQSLSTASYPSQNLDCIINNTQAHYISGNSGSNQFLDGYLSDIHFIDGQALDASSFGQFTNSYWEAIDYAGSYGTNGFHLTFQDDVVSEGFNAVTYRGNGGTQSISGLGFSPDLVWIKNRSSANSHQLVDSVRGATKHVFSNTTDQEYTYANGLTSFNTDGFSIGNLNDVNNASYNYVGWCWDAGSGSAASNTDGSITSTVKANPDYGFSIGTFTKGSGTETFGHGLTSAPELLILKRRDSTGSWFSYSSVTDATKWIRLNGTDAATTGSTFWNLTAPTSSVATISTAYNSGEQLVFYAFNSVAGYSSIGSYTGNGSSNGPFVNLGFRPAYVLTKRVDTTGEWWITDSTRYTYNGGPVPSLWTQSSGAEASSTAYGVDFLANGFKITTTYGDKNTNGGTYIYMAFADTREAAFWKDVSGQGNHWTPNNLDYRDSLIDSPANNFATFNSIHTDNTITLSEGNLKIVHGTDSGVGTTFGFNPSDATGYYAEFYKIVGSYGEIGIAPTNISDLSKPATAGKNGYVLYLNSGQKANNGSYTTYGSTVAAGDIVSVAVKDGKIWWGVNGVWIAGGDPENGTNPAFSGISGEYFFIQAYDTNAGTALQTIANFGQDSTFSGATTAGGNTDANNIGDFKYAPPSGYLALCTANLPTPTIVDGSEHFNTVLYTGDATFPRNISGVGFDLSTDGGLVWIKNRSIALSHTLWDSVRGAGANKELSSNNTTAEGALGALGTTADYGYISSLTSDGFDVAEGATGFESYVNASGNAYAAWNWKAGGAAVSNTDGSITSQVSANVDAGFSITSYVGNGTAGATIGHSLGVAPDVILVKDRSQSVDWHVYHSANTSQPETEYLILNQTLATIDAVAPWNDTAPTSSVFTVGNGVAVNTNGNNYIAYCFANSDIIKAGSYTGNGSTDGPFVYTGFRPAFVLVKMTSGTQRWGMTDSARAPNNPNFNTLYAEDSIAEYTGTAHDRDYLSNGFKLRNTDTIFNGSGATYIYLAFAETPFKYANAR